MPKRLFIKTYGCQMNVYDSQRMADLLAPLGYGAAEDAAGADLVILNTCHIREKAAEKLFSDLGRLRVTQEERAAKGGRLLLAVAGCVAQAEGEEIRRRAPHVDVVVGPQSYHRLPRLLAEAAGGAGVVDTDFPPESKFDHLPEEGAKPGISAFLTVQEGCDKFCTFCVVPYTRGAEASRPAGQIVAEAKRLLAGGARELVLLGQNVNAYHGEGFDGETIGLAGLIRALGALPGLKRLRYTTSHPRDLDAALIRAHAEVPALMPFLHLPVQSGADRILKAMNRRHRVVDYKKAVEHLRAARPDIALSSDFIVGFPGESDADFRQTLSLAAEIGYACAYSFKYSPRPGTPAAAAPDQVDEAVKEERLAELQELLAASEKAFNAAMVGRRLEVLFERPGRHPGQLAGRSPYNQAVHVEAPAHLLGEVAPVFVAASGARSLAGRLALAEAVA